MRKHEGAIADTWFVKETSFGFKNTEYGMLFAISVVMNLSSKTKVKYVPPLDAQEKHLPGMNFCGPGTDVARRLKMGVKPVDILDRACLEHDIATEPRGPYTSQGIPGKLRAADRRLLRRCRRYIRDGYRPLWKVLAVADAMEMLLLTGARGRKD